MPDNEIKELYKTLISLRKEIDSSKKISENKEYQMAEIHNTLLDKLVPEISSREDKFALEIIKREESLTKYKQEQVVFLSTVKTLQKEENASGLYTLLFPDLAQSTQSHFTIEDIINNSKFFYADTIADALRQAKEQVGEYGTIASMPYIIAGKAAASKDNKLWKNWLTALSCEFVGTDKKGKYAKQGESIVITSHNCGFSADRIQEAYNTKAYNTKGGMTDQHTVILTQDEFDAILKGTFPDGTKNIQLYNLDDINKGKIPEPLFGQYAVYLPFEQAKKTKSDYHQKKEFLNNPLVLVRAGTPDHLESYFDKAKHPSKHHVGNWHKFNQIDPTQPQGLVLFVGSDYSGLNSDIDLSDDARFVGVEHRAAKK